MALFQWPELFLAAFEQVGTVIAAILGILYIIGQVMNREDKGQAPRRRPAPPQRRAAGPERPIVQAGQNPRGGQDPRAEVERFLREVTARGRGQAPQREEDVELLRRPAAARARPAPGGPARRPPAREVPRRPLPAQEEPVEVEVIPESLGSGVGEHVRTHLGPPLAGEGMQRRVHDHLDHRLGTIRSTSEAPQRGEPRARGVHPLSLLRSPASLREAIVLSEILSEPVSLRPPQ